MKISKWSKLLAKVGVFTSMFYLLVEFSIKFPAIYVNIKKYRFKKKKIVFKRKNTINFCMINIVCIAVTLKLNILPIHVQIVFISDSKVIQDSTFAKTLMLQ